VFDILRFDEIEWEDPPRGYYLTDVKQKVLWEDKETGATLALVKFPVGVADKIHSHPEATQINIGLSGEKLMPPDNKRMKIEPNMVVTAVKGGKHGASHVTKESIVLFFWDGPPKPEIHE
jgi:mannose-6-phosphate isomerase-like protein (cupin superfamily)